MSKRWTLVFVIALLMAGIGFAVYSALMQRGRSEDVAAIGRETADLARVMRAKK